MLPTSNGRIVTISLRAGKFVWQNYSRYSASTFTLEGLMVASVKGVNYKGIKVNTTSLISRE